MSRNVRAFGAVLALSALIINGPARGAPADMSSGLTSAPAITAAPPKAKELGAGDASVSTQTGNLTYSYPIGTPPGRGKARPSVALTYSSNAPLYGGVAAGWALSGVPGVYEDTSGGRIKTRHPMYQFSEPKNDDRFISSLVGGRQLILVTEPKDLDVWGTYRVKLDETYTRFDRMKDTFSAFRWRARTSDGMTYEFGGSAAATACPGIISENHAPLTLATDAFGNTVRYSYALANGECRLTTISYGANPAAGVGDFADVSFSYAPPRHLGKAGPGRAWHHLVEQTKSNLKRFGARAIHNTANVINIGHGKGSHHARISGLYSSIRKDITGSSTMTVRQWLSTQSYDQQYAFGQLTYFNVVNGVW